MFYSGNLLWIETRRKKARKGGEVEQSRSTRLLGSATIGVCLGCVASLSLTIVGAKWLHDRVADLNAWHAYIYYAVFLSSIAWSFAWGAARSAVHLLWLCAAITVAIPLTTLLAWTFPVLGMWAHGSAATIGVVSSPSSARSASPGWQSPPRGASSTAPPIASGPCARPMTPRRTSQSQSRRSDHGRV